MTAFYRKMIILFFGLFIMFAGNANAKDMLFEITQLKENGLITIPIDYYGNLLINIPGRYALFNDNEPYDDMNVCTSSTKTFRTPYEYGITYNHYPYARDDDMRLKSYGSYNVNVINDDQSLISLYGIEINSNCGSSYFDQSKNKYVCTNVISNYEKELYFNGVVKRNGYGFQPGKIYDGSVSFSDIYTEQRCNRIYYSGLARITTETLYNFKVAICKGDNDKDFYKAIDDNCGTGNDCDDSNRHVHPGAIEITDDGIDNNCNGEIDEGSCPEINGFSATGSIDASGAGRLDFQFDIDSPYDSATITINGQGIAGTSWSGHIGEVLREGGNAVTLTVFKDGCAEATRSLLVNVVWDNEDCKYLVTLGSKANLASGELTESVELFTAGGTDLPLGLTLRYLSRDGNDGPLGMNWTHNYNMTLSEDDFGTVAVRGGNGQWTLYTFNGSGYSSRSGDANVLTRDAAGQFTLTRKDGARYEFGADNKLTSIVDRHGNTLTLTYSGDELASVSDSYGRAITLVYAVGKLASVTDPAGIIYKVDVGETLDRITLPDSTTWQFGYQDNTFLTSKLDPAGHLTTYAYDEKQRVIGSTDPEGRSRAIAYPEGNDPVRTTTFTDKDGTTWLYTYDVHVGELTAKTDPQGNVTTYSYDADHNLTAKTEPRIGTTSYSYDAAGNLLTTTDPAGNTTAYTYNAFGQVTSVTDGGATTAYEYDERGNLLKVTAPDGGSTTYQYDERGRLTQVITVTGETTALSYDAQGNVASVTGPDGQTTTFTYDAAGRRTATTDADGNITRFTYDARGQLITVLNAQGNTTRYEYDAKGNRIRVIDANGNVTSFTYNFTGQMVSMTDALGYTTSFVYGDSAGCSSCGSGVDQLTSLTDAKGQATLFQYDPLGRLIEETDPLGHVTAYGYDAAGRVTSKTDPNGRTIQYNYDTLGRLTSKSYPDGTQTTFSYDAKGNLQTATNPGIAYTFTYDGSSRLTTVADSFGYQIDYTYDAAGKRTNMSSNSGAVVNYTYDAAGRLEEIDSPAGNFTFSYDALGRRSHLAFPNGVTTTYTYDDLCRLTDLVSAKGSTLIAENHYTHDQVGNRLSNRDARTTASYGYDAIYRLTEAVSNAPGFSGNTKNSNKGTANATQNQKEIYIYDPLGNRLQTDKVRSTTHNAGNELLTADSIRYEYDANGNRISKITSGETTTYTWDVENRLTQVTLPDGKIVTFAYDPFGRRISKTADGITTRYTYDGEDILFETVNGSTGNVCIHGPGIDEPLALLDSKGPAYYHADGLGSIVALTDANAKVVQRYEYDSFGNRKDMQNTIKQPYAYTSREHDRETGLYYYRARYYDAEVGRFISEDPIGFAGGDVNLYGYVWNNPVNFIDSKGTTPFSCLYCKEISGYIAVGADVVQIGAALTGAGMPVAVGAATVSFVNSMGYLIICETTPLSLANLVTTLASAVTSRHKVLNIIITDIDAGLALSGINP